MSADPIKVYDARWEIHEFNDDQVRRLFEATLGYGRLLGVDTITLTRDARLGCGRVMELGIDVALRMGFRVFLRAEPISTPQSYFTTLYVSQEHRKTMGLAITASHNPSQYVGIKFTVPIVHAIGYDCGPMGGLTKVREIYHDTQKFPGVSGGSLHLLDLSREYVDFSLKAAGISPGDLDGIGVVLDAFNGSAGPEMFVAFIKAGARVEPLRLVPDGNFPTGSPNPTSQGKMDNAVKKAEQCHSSGTASEWAVIGIDGDGDRVVFGDRRGILTAGFAFVPILQTCIRQEGTRRAPVPLPILYDPKVSPLALAEWGGLGAKPVLFRNGHSQIKDYMTQIGALAAAEESGHYYHRITMGDLTISGENSIMTTLLFLGALKKQPGLMDKLWKLQDQVFTTGEFNYQFESDLVRDQALDAVVEHFVAEGASKVTATPDGIDLQGTCLARGVRLDPGSVKLDQGWYSGYLRIATNEKGVVRSYFSAGETTSGKRVENDARRILEKDFRGKVID
jgi:phosphomannomutase